MSRRHARLDEPERWVFNRMVQAYEARPAYPDALIEAVASHVSGRVLDLGAGIGHLALPLARRGLAITAVEAAQAMRDRLEARAREEGLPIEALHAAAESLPLGDQSLDAALIADAIHFLDVERSAHELARTLVPQGVIVVVTCELGRTPFMDAVRTVMEDAAPRRPREVQNAIARLFSITRASERSRASFDDATPVDADALARILDSISFIGPAMNAERRARFRERIDAIEGPRVWSRRFEVHVAQRRKQSQPA